MGKGRRSLSLTKKRSARGSLTVNIAGSSPSPPPTPLPTCTFCSRISLAGSVARQRAVSIENSRGSTEKVVFAAKEAAREKEGKRGRKIYRKKQAKRNHFKCGLKLSLISAAKCFC